MALFGKKNAVDAAPSTTATTDPSVIAADDNAAAPVESGKKTKAPKEKPVKAARGRVRNGTMIGLNIGNAFIKAVEVTAKNGELSITKLAMVPTPNEAYQNGNILSKTSLSNALKTLWKQGGFKGRAVVTSVAGTGALVVRVIEVPTMSDTQLADTMRLEAERYIPFPPTEVQMDFKALRDLPSDPDGGTMEVLLAAAQSEVVDLHVKVIQAARLDPRAIDVEPIALARSMNTESRSGFDGDFVDYNKIIALVNIGALSTEITLLRGDVLVFTRTVSNGGATLTQAIADSLGMGIPDAERLKIERGDALPPPGYDTGATDDFGMDDFGHGAFGDLDLTPTGGDSSADFDISGSGDDSADSNSADPFDLDFFNQGPKQPDAGAGHAQKEGQNFSFNFDDIVSPEAPQSLPSTEPKTPAANESATQAAPSPQFDFSFDDNTLPGTKSASAAPAPQSAASSPAPSAAFSEELDASLLPAVADDTPPSKESTDDGFFSMPSAFDFSDFDLPANAATTPITASITPPIVAATPVIEAPVATPAPVVAPVSEPVVEPVATTPAEPAGFSFGFQDDPATPIAETTSSAVTEAATAPSASEIENIADVPAALDADSIFALPEDTPSAPELGATAPAVPVGAPAGEPTSDALDLDSIFGTGEIISGYNENAAENASQPDPFATTAGLSATDDVLGLGGLSLGDAPTGGGLDIGAIGNEDFSSFGAGLGEAALANTDVIALYGAVEPALAELANEISRSLSFYLERVPDAELSRIYITGGGSNLRHFDTYLTQALGFETAVFNPLTQVQVAAANASSEFVAAVGPLYSVAFGLAVRDFVD